MLTDASLAGSFLGLLRGNSDANFTCEVRTGCVYNDEG